MDSTEKKVYARSKLVLFSDDEKFFGPGVADLLRLIEKTGSMRKAGTEMGMAYSKCWRVIRKAEECLGFALTIGNAGGSSGGGSTLTEEGREFLDRYSMAVRELDACIEDIQNKYF